MTVQKQELDSIQLDSIWDYPFVIRRALTNNRCLGGKDGAPKPCQHCVFEGRGREQSFMMKPMCSKTMTELGIL